VNGLSDSGEGTALERPTSIDVLGLGAVAVDDLVYLRSFPKPDTKTRMLGMERQGGGLAGTALVCAARLGSSCAYAGTLGEDGESQFITEGLAREGVDTRWIVRRPGARPYRSIILVDMESKTRTLLSSGGGVVGADPTLPDEPVIRSARVLLVDHSGLEGMLRAARIARAHGVPVVGDFERPHPAPYPDLLALTNHPILPQGYALELTGTKDTRDAATALWDATRRAVVVTMGAEGCWYVSAESPGEAIHQPAFVVAAVDTTGCGDVFHGAYASCLSRGLPMAERVRVASAAAAIKATRRGGQNGIPTLREVETFLEARSG
jgi:sulfofructose kinase